jgi:hypothetical protein
MRLRVGDNWTLVDWWSLRWQRPPTRRKSGRLIWSSSLLPHADRSHLLQSMACAVCVAVVVRLHDVAECCYGGCRQPRRRVGSRVNCSCDVDVRGQDLDAEGAMQADCGRTRDLHGRCGPLRNTPHWILGSEVCFCDGVDGSCSLQYVDGFDCRPCRGLLQTMSTPTLVNNLCVRAVSAINHILQQRSMIVAAYQYRLCKSAIHETRKLKATREQSRCNHTTS